MTPDTRHSADVLKVDIDLTLYSATSVFADIADDALFGDSQRSLGDRVEVIGSFIWSAQISKCHNYTNVFFHHHVGILGDEGAAFRWKRGSGMSTAHCNGTRVKK